MTCIRPGAVSQEDLIAYVDGEASPGVVAHVQSCAACATQVRSYARAQQWLQHALCRFNCPPSHALGEYGLGLLVGEDRSRIAAHVLACPHCDEELQILLTLLASEPKPEV